MVESQMFELNELEANEVSDFAGELSAAVNWVDEAFGEIEAEAKQFAPFRVMIQCVKSMVNFR